MIINRYAKRKQLFYFTFNKDQAFFNCIQPVYANNDKQALRLMALSHDEWDRMLNEHDGRTEIDNADPEILEPLGIN